MKKRLFFWMVALIIVLIFPAVISFMHRVPSNEHLDYSYWVMDLTSNRPLTHTTIPLSVGDEYISADNKIYRIVKITRDKAYAQEIN